MAQAGTAREFINAVIALEREYGLTLSHEDVHGAFLIEPFSELNVEWLRCLAPAGIRTRAGAFTKDTVEERWLRT